MVTHSNLHVRKVIFSKAVSSMGLGLDCNSMKYVHTILGGFHNLRSKG